MVESAEGIGARKWSLLPQGLKPYYEHNGIVIIHGDCREITALLKPSHGVKIFDLLLTDPPYGINADRIRGSSKYGWTDYPVQGDGWDGQKQPEALMEALSLCRGAIVWGGNYYASMLPSCQGWLVWDKGQREFSLADGELAWTNFDKALRITTIPRARALLDGKEHPTQKPQALIAWCLAYADRNAPTQPASVYDPFMGSGTTLVECKRLGKAAVGVEREERYCEIAAARLAQGALPLSISE